MYRHSADRIWRNKLGASTTRGTRSLTMRKELFGELYQEQSEFESRPKSKLQIGAHIIGRMLICVVSSQENKLRSTLSIRCAS